MNITGFKFINLIKETNRRTIFRAKREDDGRFVIIKFIPQEFRNDFEKDILKKEYEISKLVEGQEGILQYLSMIEDGSAIVIEDIDGISLDRLHLPLEIDLFLDFAIKITKTLGSIHSYQVVHRDIKPENILVNL